KGKGKGTDDLAEVVFVVEEGRAKMKPVKIGISDDNYYEVIDGLQEGEEVIIGPFKVLSRELKNGDPVEIKNRKNEFARAK
ncbi:MAG: efflux transporter periplasmic adaptor subunit, partial [Calditrichaeota bacterium]|nr:efflux transporter periplasmic adaptor subunit [Calditrichota bacterium]